MKPGDPGEQATGVVAAHDSRNPSMPAGCVAPYQVRCCRVGQEWGLRVAGRGEGGSGGSVRRA
jgi:hypothetical protein